MAIMTVFICDRCGAKKDGIKYGAGEWELKHANCRIFCAQDSINAFWPCNEQDILLCYACRKVLISLIFKFMETEAK